MYSSASLSKPVLSRKSLGSSEVNGSASLHTMEGVGGGLNHAAEGST
jgi:hypothetical protein